MGVRAKLFLWIGSLILFLACLMFLLPRFFIKKDINDAAIKVRSLIEAGHREIQSNMKGFVLGKIKEIQGDINALLLLTNEVNELAPQFFSLKNKDEETVWKLAARLLAYNPNLGFSQIHDPKNNLFAAVVTYHLPSYSVKASTIGDKVTLISLHKEGEEAGVPYIGVPVTSVSKADQTFYALIHWEDATEEMKKTLSLVEKQPPPEEALETYPEAKSAYLNAEIAWVDQMELINILAPLVAKGIKDAAVTSSLIPVGLARVDQGNRGVAILSEDAFRTKPLFDDAAYFKGVSAGGVELGAGNAMVVDPRTQGLFLANTMLVDGAYVTLGGAVAQSARELAMASNRTVLLSINKTYWIGYGPNGKNLEITDALTSHLTAQKEELGTTAFDGTNYYFTRFVPVPGQDVFFYILTPQQQEKSIVDTLLQLDDDLTSKISYQMFFMMIFSLIITLLILGRISLNITRPLVQLAQATEEISGGKYEEIKLPEAKGNDEIATLTKGFEGMVSGLKDREKIRGVLNKVVSKDVADEILKSSIHLGGEDRIVTMLFSDIRGFTQLTQNLSPQMTITMLNECMTKMSRIIEGEGGVIDKYVGDEIMALYGAPIFHADHALRALSAAKLMIETLKKWNIDRKIENEDPIEVGIGIHTGLVVAGNMGAEDRLNYTVLGANVNLAARLCKAAQPMQIIISQQTLEQPNVRESFFVEPLEPMLLKGFSEPIKIFEVIGFKWSSG